MSRASQLLAVALLLPLLFAARGVAQEEPEPTPPPADSQESEPAEESESEPSDVEPPAEEPPGEEPPDEEPQTEDAEPTDDDAGEEEPSEEPAPPELTPEERAKIEEARRKREERQAKREARKAAEEAKARERKAKEASKEERQEGKVLAKAYAALDREELKNALQGFRAYIDLAGKDAFAGYMGVARTQLALGEPASAIESALEAAKLTEVGAQKAEALIFAGDASLMARPRDEETLQPLPGTELYETTAVRFFLQALTADPQDNSEAIERLEQWFPTPQDERTERLYARYLEMHPAGALHHAKRLAGAYEALLTGRAGAHVAVTGGISPPVKVSGRRPPYPMRAGGKARRLVADLLIEADGTVSRAKVLNGPSPKHDRRASETLRSWVFEPARLPNGEPVPVHYVVVANAVAPSPSEDEEIEEEETTAEEEAEAEEADEG